MTPFRDLPIRRKVTLLLALTSALVVLLTAAAFMTYEWVTFRRATLGDLTTLARIIADNSTAAMQFGDFEEATSLVSTLRAETSIRAAVLYDTSGQRVASYGSSPLAPAAAPAIPPDGHVIRGSRLVVFEPVAHGDRPLGTLVLVYSLEALQRRFVLYGGMVVLILVTSSLAAFILSSRFQARITVPIQALAETAHSITSRRDYSVRATRYGRDELGALTDAFNEMLAEIQEREERLTASEERLRAALSAANMGTWRYDPARRESLVDGNFRRIFNLPAGSDPIPASEMIAQLHPDDRLPVRNALQRALQSPDAQYFLEYRLLTPEGTLRWVRDRGRVVRRPDGAADYVTGALVDISDIKHAQEQVHRLNLDLERRVAERTSELEQTNRELEAFTYSVSHDLRGPLRHISGYAEMIRDDEPAIGADSKRHLGRIVHAAEKLTRLLDSLLNLSRVGRRQLVLQTTKLDELVDAAQREQEHELKDRKIVWERQPLPTVACDPALMALVWSNLLSNAAKYTRPRDVARITIGTADTSAGMAVLVRDNGVGFDPRFKHKLFNVFERLHTASEFEGTGVGLATVERIIRKHGGRIWAESEPGQGATFFFTLPGME